MTDEATAADGKPAEGASEGTAPTANAQGTGPTGSKPRVRLETSAGLIVLELEPEAAPATCENFLRYVEEGFYDGTVFHRVIKDFMIQGGGLTCDMQPKPTRAPIVNEAGLSNQRGTIAMARTSDPHSATSQFFINHRDNTFLDASEADAGYAVFGRAVEGMEVVDAIAAAATTSKGPYEDVPVEPVVIERACVVG